MINFHSTKKKYIELLLCSFVFETWKIPDIEKKSPYVNKLFIALLVIFDITPLRSPVMLWQCYYIVRLGYFSLLLQLHSTCEFTSDYAALLMAPSIYLDIWARKKELQIISLLLGCLHFPSTATVIVKIKTNCRYFLLNAIMDDDSIFNVM